MISNISPPKNKTQLISLLQKLPPSTKVEVKEVLSTNDKLSINRLIDGKLKKGGFSLIFVSE